MWRSRGSRFLAEAQAERLVSECVSQQCLKVEAAAHSTSRPDHSNQMAAKELASLDKITYG
jgi:hypothetical protein